MSKLEELIARLCPDGVEYKSLGDLGKFYGGITGKSKEDFKDGNEKFITYMNVYSNIALKIDVNDRVRIMPNEKQRTLEYGDVIFTGSSETPDECGISSVLTIKTDEKLYLNSFCFFFRFDDKNLMLPDFSKHVFRSTYLRYQIGKTASGVTRFNVSKKLMEKVKVPVPPLEVQREIVHILDSFTFLTAELAAELAARQKQYLAYATKLIEESNSEKILVADLGSFTYGYTATALDKGDTRIVRITDIDDQGCLKEDNAKFINMNDVARKSLLKKGDLVMARTGATYGKTLYFDSEYPSVYASFLIKLTLNNQKILNRFYWHFSKTSLYWQQAEKLVTVGGQQQFNTPALKKILVPVPPLSEQQRIVDILDRFDALCNDITSGLPAEIEARKKQYEYYRDKLLTFKELKKEA